MSSNRAVCRELELSDMAVRGGSESLFDGAAELVTGGSGAFVGVCAFRERFFCLPVVWSVASVADNMRQHTKQIIS